MQSYPEAALRIEGRGTTTNASSVVTPASIDAASASAGEFVWSSADERRCADGAEPVLTVESCCALALSRPERATVADLSARLAELKAAGRRTAYDPDANTLSDVYECRGSASSPTAAIVLFNSWESVRGSGIRADQGRPRRAALRANLTTPPSAERRR